MPNRVCTFAVAHTDITGQPFNNATRTVRVFVPNNLCGEGLFIKFSNYYGDAPVWVGNASIAVACADGTLQPDTIRPLTVYGDTSFALVPNRDVFSDFISMPVQPGQTFAISLYYPQNTKISSGNFVGIYAHRSVKGDFCMHSAMPEAKLWTTLSRSVLPWDISSAITTMSAVIVQQPDGAPKPRVVAAFGDSIMQQGAWVTPFSARLYARYPGAVSLCNLGIGGNRLLHDAPALTKGIYGHAGVTRVVYDLLAIEGLTHAVFALGTNDLGLPGSGGVPEDELISLTDYIGAATRVVTELHKRGVKVIAATLLPREITHVFTAPRETLRLAINIWIRTSGVFDAVIDFEPVLLDEDGVGMKKEYALPDGLHPNLAGGKLLAESVDLDLFE